MYYNFVGPKLNKKYASENIGEKSSIPFERKGQERYSDLDG